MSTTYDLPVMESVKSAWFKLKGAKGTLWSVLILWLAAVLILEFLRENNAPDGFITLLTALAVIAQALLTWSLIYMGIQRACDLPIRFGMITRGFNVTTILYMIGFYILRALIVLPATIFLGVGSFLIHSTSVIAFMVGALLIVLGIATVFYLIVRMTLGQAIILDKHRNSWEALKLSFQITQGNFWNLTGISIINILIVLASIMTLGIGLIWSLPYLFIVYGEIYKRLTHSSQIN
jgi:hypothetical protein